MAEHQTAIVTNPGIGKLHSPCTFWRGVSGSSYGLTGYDLHPRKQKAGKKEKEVEEITQMTSKGDGIKFSKANKRIGKSYPIKTKEMWS